MLALPQDQLAPGTLATMTLLEALRRQLRYDTWANQELFGFLVGCDLVPPQAWSLHDHVLGTAANWLARMQGTEPELAIWPELSHAERPERVTKQAHDWHAFLSELDEAALEGTVTYRNSAGVEYTTQRLDVIHHVFAHAHYHRGQVAGALRRVGVDPPWTDPILWTRLEGS